MATQTDFTSSLSGEALEKAIKELRENPDTRQESLRDFRKLIEEKEGSGDVELEGVHFERKDDPFLIRFLRARKFDQERALALYVQYYSARHSYPQIFEDFTVQSIAPLLSTGVMNVIDSRTKNGEKVICIRPERWDMDAYPVHAMFKAMLLMLDKLIEEEETQVHGFCVIEDFNNIDFMRVIRMSQTEAVQRGIMISLLQDGFPARFKGFHLVNQPWYLNMLITIIKPFMKQKMKDRIVLHGYDLVSLQQYIDIEDLPADYGGSQPSLDEKVVSRLFPELGAQTDTSNGSLV